MICKSCTKEVERIHKGRRYPSGPKVWVDSIDRVWSGFDCPDCKNAKHAASITVKDKKTYNVKRRCKTCNKKLTPDRWMSCKDCRPLLGESVDDIFSGGLVRVR